MPTSDASAISPIIGALQELRPTSVLDVGPGYGKYGMLIREYLGPILRRVDAYEPWPQGMMPALRSMYDEVFPEAFPSSSNDLPYDLVLMVDVVEHYTERDGRLALIAALELAPHVLISTPRRVHPQGQVDGNPWEEHKSQWTAHSIERASECKTMVVYPHPQQIIALLSR